MVCTHPDKKSNSTLKYVDPFVGPLKVNRRWPRGWEEWSALGEDFVVHEYEVGDWTVFKDTRYDVEADKDYEDANLEKSDKFKNLSKF